MGIILKSGQKHILNWENNYFILVARFGLVRILGPPLLEIILLICVQSNLLLARSRQLWQRTGRLEESTLRS